MKPQFQKDATRYSDEDQRVVSFWNLLNHWILFRSV
jgi:hypothetical protein